MHCPAWNEPALPVMPWKMTFVSFPTSTDILASPDPLLACSGGLDRRDDLLRAVEHVLGGLDRKPAVSEDLFAELHVGALEAHDERHLETEILRRRDDAFGDDVALHDPAEDVHEDALH